MNIQMETRVIDATTFSSTMHVFGAANSDGGTYKCVANYGNDNVTSNEATLVVAGIFTAVITPQSVWCQTLAPHRRRGTVQTLSPTAEMSLSQHYPPTTEVSLSQQYAMEDGTATLVCVGVSLAGTSPTLTISNGTSSDLIVDDSPTLLSVS